MKVDKTELKTRKELAKYLKHGDISLIAEKAGVTTEIVSRYVAGALLKSGCSAYFEALAKKRKEEVEKAISEI